MEVTAQSWTGCPAILACWHYRQEVGVTPLCFACSRFDERRAATRRVVTPAEARILDVLRYASISRVRDAQGVVYQMHRDDEDRVCGAEIARRAKERAT